MSNRKKVAVIPGDDAAPEAVFPTIELLKQLDLNIDFELPPYGEEAMRELAFCNNSVMSFSMNIAGTRSIEQ